MIGLAMEPLIWAFLGGWVACYFASGREQESDFQLTRPAAASEATGRCHQDETMPHGSTWSA
jgi:hypothetical protein